MLQMLSKKAKEAWRFWIFFLRSLAPMQFNYAVSKLQNENLVVLLGSIILLSMVSLIAVIFEVLLNSFFFFLIFCILFGVLSWIFTGELLK